MVLDLQFWQILSAYIFVLILIIIVKVKGIQREKEILISSIRMTLQLILAGYLLMYILNSPSPIYTILLLAFMEGFSIYTIIKRAKGSLSPKLKKIIAFSMLSGTTLCLLYFLFIVIRISPWFNPQYFIPIAGMLIGNSMTGISLGVSQLNSSMKLQKNLIEGGLMLGASPKVATKEIVSSAFDAAILPTLNSMIGMGIVFLPGMMTGQILSGVSPLSAIEYQIAIMLGIVGSVALSVILFVQLGYKTFFNKDSQLILPPN